MGKFLSPGTLQNNGSAQGTLEFTRNFQVLKETSPCGAPPASPSKLGRLEPVKLCARCNRWWYSGNKFICNNRIDSSTTVNLWRGLSFKEGEEVYQVFSTSAVIFTRDILTRRRNRQQGKSC